MGGWGGVGGVLRRGRRGGLWGGLGCGHGRGASYLEGVDVQLLAPFRAAHERLVDGPNVGARRPPPPQHLNGLVRGAEAPRQSRGQLALQASLLLVEDVLGQPAGASLADRRRPARRPILVVSDAPRWSGWGTRSNKAPHTPIAVRAGGAAPHCSASASSVPPGPSPPVSRIRRRARTALPRALRRASVSAPTRASARPPRPIADSSDRNRSRSASLALLLAARSAWAAPGAPYFSKLVRTVENSRSTTSRTARATMLSSSETGGCPNAEATSKATTSGTVGRGSAVWLSTRMASARA